MTGIPRARQGSHRLSQAQQNRLRVLALRCRLLQYDYTKATKPGRARKVLGGPAGGRQPSDRLADLVVWALYRDLFLASVHVLIENWDRSLAYDNVIYGLLSRTGHRSALKEYRNAVFHSDPMTEGKRLKAGGRLAGIMKWAEALVDAIESHLDAHYPLPAA